MDVKSLWESTIGKGVAVILSISAVLGAVWGFDDRYAKEDDVQVQITASEARIISEVRSESADTRLIMIEDMESRLDEFDYDISIIESKSEVVPESLRIKRNMLDRRIQRLKDNENNNTPDTS